MFARATKAFGFKIFSVGGKSTDFLPTFFFVKINEHSKKHDLKQSFER